MLGRWIRTIHNNNGTNVDFSLSSQNRTNYVFDYVAGQDSLIIGQYFPFNNVYAEIPVVNDVASVASVSIWNGREWEAAVDVIDGTAVGGKSLAQSGVIQFTPDKNANWKLVQDPRTEAATILVSNLAIFDMYWAKIDFTVSLKATTAIKSLCYAFTTDRYLLAIDPEINRYITSWEAGKTTWTEQIITASDNVIQDLKARQLIVDAGNVLRFDDVCLATAYKTLINIYNMMGEDFLVKKSNCEKAYDLSLNIKNFTFDKNDNGKVERSEVRSSGIRGIR